MAAASTVAAAAVVGTTKTAGGITMYQLACTDGRGGQWVMARRYTEFETLRADLVMVPACLPACVPACVRDRSVCSACACACGLVQ